MIRVISKINHRFYLAIAAAILTLFSIIEKAAVGGPFEDITTVKSEINNIQVLRPLKEMYDLYDQRINFATHHGVADPAALVAAVWHSPMANLLISVAIEESRGDPVAVGKSGEQGAWQVIASHWGLVPKDIHGQAGQAERIISTLLAKYKGNQKKALAHYNGGTTPPGKSYRYAERILKRARHLQVAFNYLPPDYSTLRKAVLDPPGKSWII